MRKILLRHCCKRNQLWEIDRIIYAAKGYSWFKDFKKDIIQMTKGYKNTNKFFMNSVEIFQICYTYVKDILLPNLSLFIEVGNRLVRSGQ